MQPDLKAGYILSMQIREKRNEGLVAPADSWKNVDEIIIPKANAPKKLAEGDTAFIQINKVGERVAKAQPFSFRRADTLKPGYTIETLVTKRSETNYDIGEVRRWPHINKIHLYGNAPVRTLNVPIDAVVPLDGVAITDISHYTWPTEGEQIKVEIKQGQQMGCSAKYGYEISLDSRSPVSGVATAKATYSNRELQGIIYEYPNHHPNIGDTITAYLDYRQNEKAAFFSEEEDWVQLDISHSISGEVKVKMTQVSHPLQGTLVELPPEIPNSGEQVRAFVTRQNDNAYAKPVDFTGRLRIPDGAEVTGFVTVEITNAGTSLQGKIVEYEGMPSKGDVVQASVRRGSPPSKAQTTVGNIDIHLQEQVLATGEVDVQITESSQLLKGKIISYRDLLPEVGDIVSAEIESHTTLSMGHPLHYSYVIHILDSDDYEGHAEVEIIEVDDRVVGDVITRVDTTQSTNQMKSESPFKNSVSRPNITRKKH